MKKLALALTLATSLSAQEDVKLDSATLGGLRARSIGPAVMGGRIAALDGYAAPDTPSTVYAGAASGGVWKSTDNGTTFKPVFDEHTQSIGAVSIDKQNPQTVWVGTGESWVRNSVSVGTGVYKTTDGGATWTNLGLGDTEHISRIAIHPKQSDTVFVCATGHAWNANEERGVFKTTDGGKTWKKTLYVDQNTGCADISQDPGEPSILYAGMWDYRRQPDSFRSGGPGSGLYRSTDGGDTWHKLTEGLPAGQLGRIAVAVAPSRPSTVYAVVEAKKTALYRSDDLGLHWKEMNDSFNIQQRPFYFAHIVVDPHDHNRVYKPGLMLTYSVDGGKTFSGSIMGGGGGVHSDHHALWINPRNTNEMFLGTDGGLYHSLDRAQKFRAAQVLPISQFYHVNFDMAMPYNVYGGLQDNGTWTAPSQAPGGVANRHWRSVNGGDGFAVETDADGQTIYAESQGGRIVRYRRGTGESKEIFPFAKEGEEKLRFNWNTPIYASPTQKGTLYLGSQYLMRSRDGGETWERISPDLTTNDRKSQQQLQSGGLTVDNSSAENHTTLITINESVKDPNVLWVGTDDGNVQVTTDGGKNWTNVAANVKGVPPRTWVSRVESSHFDANTAYATFDGHRTGDMKTYVFRTRDLGKTWEPLATADVKGYAHVIREDLVNPNLLFLGTEMGLYLSLDGGKSWAQFKENFPHSVPVNDVKIHPRDGDAVIGTHGRGIYIIDDLSPLRALTTDALAKEVVMLPSRPSKLSIPAFEARSDGDTDFSSGGVDDVASITYYLKKRHVVGDSKVEVYDASNKLVATLPAGKRKGINRVDWATRLKSPKMPAGSSIVFSGGSFVGPRNPPGRYTVKLIKGKETYTSTVDLVADPRADYTAEDRAMQQKTVVRLYDMLADFTYLTDRVKSLRDQANARAEKLSGADKKKLTDFAAKLDAQYKTLVSTMEGGWLSGEEQLRERLASLYGAINNYDGRPTGSQLGELEQVTKELSRKQTEFDAAAKQVDALNKTLAAKKLDPLKIATREEWEKQDSGSAGGMTEMQFRQWFGL